MTVFPKEFIYLAADEIVLYQQVDRWVYCVKDVVLTDAQNKEQANNLLFPYHLKFQ